VKTILTCAGAMLAALALANAQAPKKAPASPPAEASVTIAGKAIGIKYSAPSVKSRQIFGAGGVVSKDGTYPVWRAGANAATALHTEADLEFKGLKVPKGDYTIYAQVDTDKWQLIISKQTKQWGTEYNKAQDLGRVAFKMSKPKAQVETLKYTLTAKGNNGGTLRLEWDKFVAEAEFKVAK
jgi:hypothetical protein